MMKADRYHVCDARIACRTKPFVLRAFFPTPEEE